MNEEEASKMFYDIFKNGEFPDDSLTEEHFSRGFLKEKIGENKFRFTIERHPHLFNRQSKGKPSSAFAIVKRSFVLDVETRKIDWEEEVLDIEIDYWALANEDVEGIIDILQDDHKTELLSLESPEDVKKFAKEKFDTFDWWGPYEPYVNEHNLPPNFREKLEATILEIFTDKILKEWKFKRKTE